MASILIVCRWSGRVLKVETRRSKLHMDAHKCRGIVRIGCASGDVLACFG